MYINYIDSYKLTQWAQKRHTGFDNFEILMTKAVNREDKRSRRYRDRDFAKFERSRRYRDRYRC